MEWTDSKQVTTWSIPLMDSLDESGSVQRQLAGSPLDVRHFGGPAEDAVERRDELAHEAVQRAARRAERQQRVELSEVLQRRRPRQVFRLAGQVRAQRQRHRHVQHAGPAPNVHSQHFADHLVSILWRVLKLDVRSCAQETRPVGGNQWTKAEKGRGRERM